MPAIILGSLLGDGRCLRSGSRLRAAGGADGRVPETLWAAPGHGTQRPRLRQERNPRCAQDRGRTYDRDHQSVVAQGRRQPAMLLLLRCGLNKPVFEAGFEDKGVRAG